jgi:hypothetical protein
MRRDWILEMMLGWTLLMAGLPSLIAYRALIQPGYHWGWFGVSGQGASPALFWLVAPLAAVGWAAFVLGARRPGRSAAALLVGWFALWLAAAIYGAVRLGPRMTLHGDAWGVAIPVNVAAPAISALLFAASIYWALRRSRLPHSVQPGRYERVLLLVGAALTPVIVAAFAQGHGERHTDWDRFAVLAFVAQAVLIGAGVNPQRNRLHAQADHTR